MTFLEMIRKVELIAAKQPAIKTIVENDIYILNQKPDVRYQVFAFTQGTHSADSLESETQYGMTFFYVDRLLPNHSNLTEIQSQGIRVLKNVLRTIADTTDILVGDLSFQPFTERFADECAGVYVTTTLTCPDSDICAEEYDDVIGGNGTDMVIFDDGEAYVEDGVLIINKI